MNISSLYRWGKKKGINIIGTGDFTHPAWFAELQEKLEPAEPGLFKLKDEYAREHDEQLPSNLREKLIRFVLSVEISNIYSKREKVRKVHNLVIVPSFSIASKINAQLSRIGNLTADGRPILGLDSKELLKITLESDPETVFIPAHAWTPWFGIYGSKSGFDSLEEAFEELTPHVHAIETGLSSDPFMNWRLSQLENITLISNSDAHSPAKLGREANIIESDLNYKDILGAIMTNDDRFVGTIEFFPEEGKYHYDGHRACGVRYSPEASQKLHNICPICGRPLTLGVDHRISKLADRPVGYQPKNMKKVEYIIPLVEIIAQISNVKSVNSKTVKNLYEQICLKVDDEFSVLRTVPVSQIYDQGFSQLAVAIEQMRIGNVKREPGYDGLYGEIRVNIPTESQPFEQLNLLG